MIFKDQIQRVFELNKTPKRIISLVPSQTELLVDLGLDEAVVGITKFCIHPKHLKNTKSIVGGTKVIKLDAIRALQPDIILCNKEENTQDIVEACSTICPVHVSDIYTLENCLELILQYGMLFSVEAVAKNLTEEISLKYTNFNALVKSKRKVKTAYLIWRNPWMAVGGHTFIDAMLSTNKFENVFGLKQRYPEVTLEDLAKSKPELILLSSEPYPFKEKHIKELLNYGINAKIMLVDGEAFSWYGSRLKTSFSYFKELHNLLE